MTVRALRGSVVIAAHNEAAVISRCLTSLLPSPRTRLFQVIVVCNGCTDATAAIARAFEGVTVLELSVASKTAALRRGDQVAEDGPRIYLDADIQLTENAAVAVLEALAAGLALAARPPIRFDYEDARLPVRSWYRVREQLPSISEVLWGAGTYALSEAGRERFDEFPEIVSDDLFIHSLFADDEVVIVKTDPVVVRAPRTTADLLKILVRTYRTQADVQRGSSERLVSSGQRGQLSDIVALVRRNPLLAPQCLAYAALIVYARARARARPGSVGWERDNSSRL